MKKILFVCSMILATISASAQFTVYQNADVPRSSRTPSMGYGVPYTIYEPAYVTPHRQQAPQPQMHEVTLRGYYKDANGWHGTPIRVGVIGDEVRLLSIKSTYSWLGCGSTASCVGGFDPEEVRDNFNYKAFSPTLGTIYF